VFTYTKPRVSFSTIRVTYFTVTDVTPVVAAAAATAAVAADMPPSERSR